MPTEITITCTQCDTAATLPLPAPRKYDNPKEYAICELYEQDWIFDNDSLQEAVCPNCTTYTCRDCGGEHTAPCSQLEEDGWQLNRGSTHPYEGLCADCANRRAYYSRSGIPELRASSYYRY